MINAIAIAIGQARIGAAGPPVATAATSVTTSSFTANWNAYSGASFYLLDVSTSSTFTTFVAGYQDLIVMSTSQSVTGLTAGTYYYRVRAATQVDVDNAAFMSRLYTAGGSMTYTEATATDQLVTNLKTYGIWTAMKAVYPMVGSSAAACAQNLKSSSYTGSFSSGWTFASTGVTPNGTSAYMNTNLICETDLFGKDSSIGYYSRTNNSGLYAEIGNFGTSLHDSIGFYTNLSNIFYLDYPNEEQRNTTSNTNSTGFYLANNSSSVGKTLFRNSTKIINTSFSNFDFPITANPKITIGATYLGTGGRYSNRQIAFAYFATALTDTQASDFYTAVQAFQTTLSRQV